MRTFEGEVVQTAPQFIAESSDAEVYFHPTLKEAVDDAREEVEESVAAGWEPYTGA